MAPALPRDEDRLQAFYDTQTKYHPAPVPTPLDRDTAIAFVNAKANDTTAPEKMRKLVRLAVFYDLQETAAAFSGILRGNESQSADIFRSSFGLIALAWIGEAVRQPGMQQYFHTLEGRADVELHRDIMLEVVEAFGPREGTGFHRQWIQSAIVAFQEKLRQEQAAHNIPGAKLMQEKINGLNEYLNIQLALVDRALSIRHRIDAMTPPRQIQPLVAYSLSIMTENSPQLSWWASMRLLRSPATLHNQVAAEFYAAGSARPGEVLMRARGLRAAQYFGYGLPEPDSQWLAGQPDTGTDPLVLRPHYYAV
jgi:hypothetical protein